MNATPIMIASDPVDTLASDINAERSDASPMR